MKLNEKICHCRRKAGLSQEALAERLGVSRQAISKWETGEASPEISKLPLLARTFGVTADWLLDENDPPADEPAHEDPANTQASDGPPQGHPYADSSSTDSTPAWVDKLPGFLARLIRMYGWLVGVRMAIAGALFTAMGFVARAMFSSIFDSDQMSGMLGGFGGSGVTFFDAAGNMVAPGSLGLSSSDLNAMGLGGFGSSVMTSPTDIFTGFIIILGLVMLIGGVWLAWRLKQNSSDS